MDTGVCIERPKAESLIEGYDVLIPQPSRLLEAVKASEQSAV